MELEKSSNGTLIFILHAALAVDGLGDFNNDDYYKDEDYVVEDGVFIEDVEKNEEKVPFISISINHFFKL